MVKLLLLFLSGALLSISSARPGVDTGGKIEIKLVIPEKSAQVANNPCLKVTVLIINHTDSIASFFDNWYSYGYYNLEFEVRSRDSVFQLPIIDKDWIKNIPTAKALFPGDTLIIDLPNSRNPCPFSQYLDTSNVILAPGNKLKAIYQLRKGALEHFMKSPDAMQPVKYKYESHWNLAPKYRKILDSVKQAVPAYQTFPTGRLESDEISLY